MFYQQCYCDRVYQMNVYIVSVSTADKAVDSAVLTSDAAA